MSVVKVKKTIVHGITMMLRNRKNYLMLAITIILSFSILLGYMTYSDSILYNRYKQVFSSPENVVIMETQSKKQTVDALLSAEKKKDHTLKSYSYVKTATYFPQYSGEAYVGAGVYFVPSCANPFLLYEFLHDPLSKEFFSIEWIHGFDMVAGSEAISNNDAIVNESFYKAVLKKAPLPASLSVPIIHEDNSVDFLSLQITGVCKDTDYDRMDEKTLDGHTKMYGSIYCNYALLSGVSLDDLESAEHYTVITTKDPGRIVERATSLNIINASSYQARQLASEQMQKETDTKMWISIILYLILGINLFGCFENALEKRKFEIGVKRAIGASKLQIILQFLIEGVLVMAFSILISAVIVTELMTVYKLYLLVFHHTVWTISLSAGSLKMYIVCSTSMTMLFSILFAYRTTNVEIVKYLKAE